MAANGTGIGSVNYSVQPSQQDLVQKVFQDYPSFAYLLQDPEVGPLLLEAVDPNKGFSAQEFQAKLEQTNWWKTHTDAQRQWQTLTNENPAEATQQTSNWKAALYSEGLKLGVQLNDAQVSWIAGYFQPLGFAPTDPRVVTDIATFLGQHPNQQIAGGDYQATTDLVKKTAADYMIDLPQDAIGEWAGRITTGSGDVQGLQSALTQLAKGRFAGYSSLIDQGITPSQIFSPYKTTIANELEVSPDSIDLMHDPRWSQVTGVVGNDNTLRPMTMSEAIRLARTQPEWQQTAGARQQGADMTQNILKTFGAIA